MLRPSRAFYPWARSSQGVGGAARVTGPGWCRSAACKSCRASAPRSCASGSRSGPCSQGPCAHRKSCRTGWFAMTALASLSALTEWRAFGGTTATAPGPATCVWPSMLTSSCPAMTVHTSSCGCWCPWIEAPADRAVVVEHPCEAQGAGADRQVPARGPVRRGHFLEQGHGLTDVEPRPAEALRDHRSEQSGLVEGFDDGGCQPPLALVLVGVRADQRREPCCCLDEHLDPAGDVHPEPPARGSIHPAREFGVQSPAQENCHEPEPRSAARRLPPHAHDPRLRGEAHRAGERREDGRLHAPLRGRRSRRRRRLPAAHRHRLRGVHAPRPRPLHRQGRGCRSDDGGAVRARDRLLPGQGRLDAHRRHGQGHARRKRHRRRRHPAHDGRGAHGEAQAHRRCRGGLLRRRRQQPGRLPRVAQHGGELEAAGRLRGREQRLGRVHADGVRDPGEGHRDACGLLCDGERDRGRHGLLPSTPKP